MAIVAQAWITSLQPAVETAAQLSACLATLVQPEPKAAALISACLLHIVAACPATMPHASHSCGMQPGLEQKSTLAACLWQHLADV